MKWLSFTCKQLPILHPKSSLLLISILILLVDANIASAQKTDSITSRLEWEYSAGGEVKDISVSENGKYIGLVTGDDNHVYLFDSNGNILVNQQTKHNAWGVSVSSEGLTALGTSYYVYMYDSNGQQRWNYSLVSLTPEEMAIRSYDVAISSDGNYVAASIATGDKANSWLFFFDANGNILWNTTVTLNRTIKSLAISSDGSMIVAGTNEGYVHVYDKNGKLVWAYRSENAQHQYDIKTPVAVSPNGETIVVGNSVGTVLMFARTGDTWVPDTLRPVSMKAFDSRPVAGISLCSNYIFSLSDTGVVQPFSRSGFGNSDDSPLTSYELSSKRGQALSSDDSCKKVAIAQGHVATIANFMEPIPPQPTPPPPPRCQVAGFIISEMECGQLSIVIFTIVIAIGTTLIVWFEWGRRRQRQTASDTLYVPEHASQRLMVLNRPPEKAKNSNDIQNTCCGTLEEFNKIKNRVVSKSYPSRGNDLEGMAIDFDWQAPESLFNDYPKIDYPAGLEPMAKVDNLIVEYDLKDDVELDKAASGIEELWVSRLSYRYFEAHFVERFEEKIVMHFITQINQNGFYVAGRLVIRRFSDAERNDLYCRYPSYRPD